MVNKLLKSLLPYRLTRNGMGFYYENKIIGKSKILDGPFKGMKYTKKSFCGSHTPKLIGTYEYELRPYLNKIKSSKFDGIIDVGAAEGYYAVGLALTNPSLPIIAYEQDASARRLISEMAKRNGVERNVKIRATCETKDLKHDLQNKNMFLLMDVEGYEEVLLDPVQVPELKKTTILFESHDLYSEGIGNRIINRFKITHKISRIDAQPRNLQDINYLPLFFKLYIKHNLIGMMGERPLPMNWYYMEPQ